MSAKTTPPDEIPPSIKKHTTIIIWNAFSCCLLTKMTRVDELCSCYKRMIYMLACKEYYYYVLQRLYIFKKYVAEVSQLC